MAFDHCVSRAAGEVEFVYMMRVDSVYKLPSAIDVLAA